MSTGFLSWSSQSGEETEMFTVSTVRMCCGVLYGTEGHGRMCLMHVGHSTLYSVSETDSYSSIMRAWNIRRGGNIGGEANMVARFLKT